MLEIESMVSGYTFHHLQSSKQSEIFSSREMSLTQNQHESFGSLFPKDDIPLYRTSVLFKYYRLETRCYGLVFERGMTFNDTLRSYLGFGLIHTT